MKMRFQRGIKDTGGRGQIEWIQESTDPSEQRNVLTDSRDTSGRETEVKELETEGSSGP